MAGKKMTVHLTETTCPVCGKTFFPCPGHVYKDKRQSSKRVCSWGCVCKSERLKEEAAERRKATREQKKAGVIA